MRIASQRRNAPSPTRWRTATAVLLALVALLSSPGHADEVIAAHAHDCATEGHAPPSADRSKATPTVPTLVNYALTPTVIASTATGNVRLAARIDGPAPTSV